MKIEITWNTGFEIVVIALLSLLFSHRSTRTKRSEQDTSDEYHHDDDDHSDTEQRERKERFLNSKHGKDYGYRNSEKGFIDNWRSSEFPHLIPPLGQRKRNDCAEVYLDSAGSALPSTSLLEGIHRYHLNNHLGNPHSMGPAALRSKALIEMTKTRLLAFFGANAGSMYGYDQSTSSESEQNQKDYHPGYDIIFTSGSTESLRIVAENFNWSDGDDGQAGKSVLLYSKNCHTSVIGMREIALCDGASFHCETIYNIIHANIDDFDSWSMSADDGYTIVNRIPKSQNEDAAVETTKHLLVLPLECNFEGETYDVIRPFQTCRKSRANWVTMLDISKAASTSSIDLCSLDPDFACVSFYKCFGAPTGLGALFIKRSSEEYLIGDNKRKYFGGGSVDVVSTTFDFVHRRQNVSCLNHGTQNFRSIPLLNVGLDDVASLGGMDQISKHTSALTHEAMNRLNELYHDNGSPAVVIYNRTKSSDDCRFANDVSSRSIVTFNLLRPDGAFIGYNEVCKLAELYKYPIQFRTGCFCNPGSCQDALGLSDTDVKELYTRNGHVCGDHIDIVSGQPTGCLRISFGKESIFEDMDTFIEFVKNVFISSKNSYRKDSIACSTSDKSIRLDQIFVFPIKSCGAFEVSSWPFDMNSNKLEFDREFVLVDSSGVALRLNQYPKMCLLSTKIDLKEKILTVSAPGHGELLVDIENETLTSKSVKMCGNKCFGYLHGDTKISDWFTSYIGVRCWLVKWAERPNVSDDDDDDDVRRRGFANEAPILLLSLSSIRQLNNVLKNNFGNKVDARHFRPNIVVSVNSNDMMNTEDSWKKIHFLRQKFSLKITGQCQRCSMIDIDPSSGTKGHTLRALAEFRRKHGGSHLTFGVFATVERRNDASNTGRDHQRLWINVGDNMIFE